MSVCGSHIKNLKMIEKAVKEETVSSTFENF